MNKNQIPPEIAEKMQQYLYDEYLAKMKAYKRYNLVGFFCFCLIAIGILFRIFGG